MVIAAGYDWDSATARTVPAGQTMVREDGISSSVTGGDFWTQRLTDPTALSGTAATIADTAPTAEKWDLAAVEVVPAATPSVSIDTTSSVDAVAGSIVSAPVTTSGSSETLLALVSVDGRNGGGPVTAVTGGGLSWSLVERESGQPGDVEVWSAHASAPLSGATVTAALSNEGGPHSLTVVALSGAAGVGAVAEDSGSGSAPTVSLTSTVAGSMVFGVGNDKDDATPRTLAAGQTLVHEDSDTTWGEDYWVQRITGTVGAAGSTAMIADAAPASGDQWNLAAVEITPAGTVTVPPSTTVTEYAYSGGSSAAWAELTSTGRYSSRRCRYRAARPTSLAPEPAAGAMATSTATPCC